MDLRKASSVRLPACFALKRKKEKKKSLSYECNLGDNNYGTMSLFNLLIISGVVDRIVVQSQYKTSMYLFRLQSAAAPLNKQCSGLIEPLLYLLTTRTADRHTLG